MDIKMNEAFKFDKKIVKPRNLVQIIEDNNWKNNPKQLMKDFPKLKKPVKYKGETYMIKFLTKDKFVITVVKNGKDVPLVLDKQTNDLYKMLASHFFGITNGNQLLYMSGFEYPKHLNKLQGGGFIKDGLRETIKEMIKEVITEDSISNAKQALKDAGVPYSFKKDKIGNKSVFLKSSNIDYPIKQLKKAGWKGGMKKSAPSSGAVVYSFKKGNNELDIYMGGYDNPEVKFR